MKTTACNSSALRPLPNPTCRSRTLWATGLAICLVALGLHLDGHADGIDHWRWRNPLPPANAIGGLAYGNGLFVAVCSGGIILTSADGEHWIAESGRINATLNRVVFANGIFVAIGNKGVVYTSPDGRTWTARQSGTGTNLLSLVYGNSVFVAGGAGGTVLTSGNGIQWTVSSAGTENDLSWSAFGNGKFILPTPSASQWAAAKVLASTNGINWTQETVTASGGGSVYQVVFANGKFLAYYISANVPTLPVFLSSPDGINWTWLAESFYFHDQLFSLNDQFAEVMAVSSSSTNWSIRFSSDALTWTTPVALPLAYSYQIYVGFVSAVPVLSDAAYANGKFVLVGAPRTSLGAILTSTGVIINSTNGENWSLVSDSPMNFTAHMAWGNGLIVAVGSAFPGPKSTFPPGPATLFGYPAAILVSTNGISFAPAPLASTQAMACVSYNGTNFVAVGRGGALQRSTNGLHWTVRSAATASDLASTCYGSNIWVVVGVEGTIVTSPDSLVWTLRSSGTSLNLYGVTYHGGRFVAVGEQGTVLTSPDGINWTGQFADTPNALQRIVWGNDRFVAVGRAGTVLTSPNGETWTTQTSPTTNSLFGLSFGNGQFLALGTVSSRPGLGVPADYGSDNSCLLRSHDGADWSPVAPPSDQMFATSTFASNTFWIAGNAGAILESDAVTGQPALSAGLTAGLFQLTVSGMSGQSFRIQACTNLSSDIWSDKAFISNSLPIEIWTEADSTNSSRRFYRTVSP